MTLEEFFDKYPHCDIVNYDIASFGGYGVTYRTDSRNGAPYEKFYNENGKYITYPRIQNYLKLESNSRELLFIIKDNSIYKLKAGEGNTYKIDYKLEDVNTNIFDFMFEKNYPKAHAPVVMDNQEIYEIIE